MKATVTKAFTGRRDDDTVVTNFVPGDVVEGDLAAVAVRNGWAKKGAAEPEPEPESVDEEVVEEETDEEDGVEEEADAPATDQPAPARRGRRG